MEVTGILVAVVVSFLAGWSMRGRSHALDRQIMKGAIYCASRCRRRRCTLPPFHHGLCRDRHAGDVWSPWYPEFLLSTPAQRHAASSEGKPEMAIIHHGGIAIPVMLPTGHVPVVIYRGSAYEIKPEFGRGHYVEVLAAVAEEVFP